MTPTIYIDHSIVSHEPWWPSLEQAMASGRLRLALSLWNLFEIGADGDKTRQEKRLAFLEKLDPLWIIERLAIQKQEVERFLCRHKFGRDPKELIAIAPSLSTVDAFLTGWQMRIGLTPRQFIRETDYATLNQLKTLSPQAQHTWRSADQKTLDAKQKEIFCAWLGPMMPDRDPENRLLTGDQRAGLLEFCHQNNAHFLGDCPAIAVEDVLTIVRIQPPTRKLSESDGTDLQHSIAALSYCDIFFTRDRDQARCAEAARGMLSTLHLAQVCASPDNLVEVVSGLQMLPV